MYVLTGYDRRLLKFASARLQQDAVFHLRVTVRDKQFAKFCASPQVTAQEPTVDRMY